MKKRIILFMAIVAMSFSVVGCVGDNNSITNSSHISSSYTSEKVSADDSYETVAVPDGGWTVEELARTIRFNGVTIELPFTVESLGEDYEFTEESAIWGIDKPTPMSTATLTLMYKNVEFATFYVTGTENKDINDAKSLDVVRFSTASNALSQDRGQLLNINGITLGSTTENVMEALGEPDDIGGVSYIYYNKLTRNKIITVQIDDNGIVIGFTVHLKNE